MLSVGLVDREFTLKRYVIFAYRGLKDPIRVHTETALADKLHYLFCRGVARSLLVVDIVVRGVNCDSQLIDKLSGHIRSCILERNPKNHVG